jgi:hypothetical protein
VKFGGVDELHAVPAGRDRTPGHRMVKRTGNPGSMMF